MATTAPVLRGFPLLAHRFLPTYLRVFAVVSFAVGALFVAGAAFDVNFRSVLGTDVGGTLEHVFRWNHHPAEKPPGAMLGAIYVAWSIFIWRSARDPLGNRMFIDFTVAGNAAHGAIMIYLALTMPGMQEHLYTDTLILILSVPVLLALWLPVRSRHA